MRKLLTQRNGERQAPEDLARPTVGHAASSVPVWPPFKDVGGQLVGGRPLDAETRHYFEPRFGADFSQVRIHDDGESQRAAARLDSRAFTFGRNIAFAKSEHPPESDQGRRLLAHELAHVVQQSGATGAPSGVRMSTPGDAGEREADHAATQVSAGREVRIGQRTTTPMIQREPTQPRAATGGDAIADVTGHTGPSSLGNLDGRSARARRSGNSSFSRHLHRARCRAGGKREREQAPALHLLGHLRGGSTCHALLRAHPVRRGQGTAGRHRPGHLHRAEAAAAAQSGRGWPRRSARDTRCCSKTT